ncbi:MAG: hypothetical protein ACI8W8_003959 [Rhodothermales bacterium]|jgi:hypothetical protein
MFDNVENPLVIFAKRDCGVPTILCEFSLMCDLTR